MFGVAALSIAEGRGSRSSSTSQSGSLSPYRQSEACMVRESCTLTIRRQHDISTVSPRDHAHASGHTHSGQRPAWTARTHVTHTLTRTHMCVRSIPHAYGYPPTELVRRQSNGRTSGSAMLGQEHSEVRASPHVEVVGVQVVPVRRKTNARMHACFEGVSR